MFCETAVQKISNDWTRYAFYHPFHKRWTTARALFWPTSELVNCSLYHYLQNHTPFPSPVNPEENLSHHSSRLPRSTKWWGRSTVKKCFAASSFCLRIRNFEWLGQLLGISGAVRGLQQKLAKSQYAIIFL